MSEFNTNKSELLQIADSVAREKLIEPHLVVEAMVNINLEITQDLNQTKFDQPCSPP